MDIGKFIDLDSEKPVEEIVEAKIIVEPTIEPNYISSFGGWYILTPKNTKDTINPPVEYHRAVHVTLDTYNPIWCDVTRECINEGTNLLRLVTYREYNGFDVISVWIAACDYHLFGEGSERTVRMPNNPITH